jgi:hypothetical protein
MKGITTTKINLPLLSTVVLAIAGVIGSILTPLNGTGLIGAAQAVLQAIAGLLVVIPTYHVASVAAYSAKTAIDAKAKA